MTPSKSTPNPRIAEDQRVVQIFPEQRDIIFKQNKRVFRLLLHNLTKLQWKNMVYTDQMLTSTVTVNECWRAFSKAT
jgi:hypothetical protein